MVVFTASSDIRVGNMGKEGWVEEEMVGWGMICNLMGLLDSMVKIIFPSMAQIKSWR